jgi:hypothetical protein
MSTAATMFRPYRAAPPLSIYFGIWPGSPAWCARRRDYRRDASSDRRHGKPGSMPAGGQITPFDRDWSLSSLSRRGKTANRRSVADTQHSALVKTMAARPGLERPQRGARARAIMVAAIIQCDMGTSWDNDHRQNAEAMRGVPISDCSLQAGWLTSAKRPHSCGHGRGLPRPWTS